MGIPSHASNANVHLLKASFQKQTNEQFVEQPLFTRYFNILDPNSRRMLRTVFSKNFQPKRKVFLLPERNDGVVLWCAQNF
jgi:hypothetical protein